MKPLLRNCGCQFKKCSFEKTTFETVLTELTFTLLKHSNNIKFRKITLPALSMSVLDWIYAKKNRVFVTDTLDDSLKSSYLEKLILGCLPINFSKYKEKK